MLLIHMLEKNSSSSLREVCVFPLLKTSPNGILSSRTLTSLGISFKYSETKAIHFAWGNI